MYFCFEIARVDDDTECMPYRGTADLSKENKDSSFKSAWEKGYSGQNSHFE